MDGAVSLGGEAFDDGESKAEAAADSFGGEVGLERAIENFGGHAGTVVLNRDGEDWIAIGLGLREEAFGFGIFMVGNASDQARFDIDAVSFVGALEGVDGEVEEDGE